MDLLEQFIQISIWTIIVSLSDLYYILYNMVFVQFQMIFFLEKKNIFKASYYVVFNLQIPFTFFHCCVSLHILLKFSFMKLVNLSVVPTHKYCFNRNEQNKIPTEINTIQRRHSFSAYSEFAHIITRKRMICDLWFVICLFFASILSRCLILNKNKNFNFFDLEKQLKIKFCMWIWFLFSSFFLVLNQYVIINLIEQLKKIKKVLEPN